MNYIFELNHPKHYYQFKVIMSLLKREGHSIKVLARDKDVLLKVLKEEGVQYEVFGVHKDSIIGKVFSSLGIYLQYKKIAKRFSPDAIVSKASLYGVIVAKRLRCKSFIFPDSEVVSLTNKVVAPLASVIITPESFAIDYGPKHKRIKGLFEDCYLSPIIYQIDYNYPEAHGLTRPYAILRFVGWTANHDVNNNGFSLKEKVTLVNSINRFMTVYISSEKELPKELAIYKLNTPTADIHNVLANADLYVGDSQTMATEAALLGTPAIRSNSFVGQHDMSNFKMLEDKGLLINIKEYNIVLDKATEYARTTRKEEWLNKRKSYYSNVGDVNNAILKILGY